MGTVFEATHLRFQTSVAIKIFDPNMMRDHDLRERFALEARVLARIRSMHMVDVLDADVLPDGVPYIVMEMLHGCDLETEMGRHRPHLLAIEDAVDYVRQAAAGMTAAHANGIIHRDIKPANLFLCTLPYALDRRLVKIVDFGIARIADDAAVRRTGSADVFGTPQYMAPEQVWRARAAGPASDQWSLGVVLYELLSGRPPFEGESPSAVVAAIASQPVPALRSVRADIPSELEAVVMRALEKDPAARFPTLVELIAALEPFGHPVPIASVISMPRTSSPELGPPSSRPDTVRGRPGPITERAWESGGIARGRASYWIAAVAGTSVAALLVAMFVAVRSRATDVPVASSPVPDSPPTASVVAAPPVSSAFVPGAAVSAMAVPEETPPKPSASTAPPRAAPPKPPKPPARLKAPKRDPLAP